MQMQAHWVRTKATHTESKNPNKKRIYSLWSASGEATCVECRLGRAGATEQAILSSARALFEKAVALLGYTSPITLANSMKP